MPASALRKTALQLWLGAVRPRTLLLAVASIALGVMLARAVGPLDWLTVILTFLTATLLQILSNLANDYGDTLHGADSSARAGPVRAVQSGQVTPQLMQRAMLLSAVLAAVSGLLLVRLALGPAGLLWILGFLLLGAAAIWAAIAYTATARPYGYAGLGDLMVFVFFGPVAVLGSYFLQARQLNAAVLLPAASVGLLAVGVLNINNLRDMKGDAAAGKLSVPVRIGPARARIYHSLLLAGALILAAAFVLLDYHSAGQWLFLLVTSLLLRNALHAWRLSGAQLDPLLKQLALTTLLFVLLFGAGQLLD
jgi:1,4-dihydroxy-2-naphthoate octaprenyltransferase